MLALVSLVWYAQKVHQHRLTGRPYAQYGAWRDPGLDRHRGEGDGSGGLEVESEDADAEVVFIEMLDLTKLKKTDGSSPPDCQRDRKPVVKATRPVYRGETPLHMMGKPPGAYSEEGE